MKQIIELNNGTFKVLNTKGIDYYVVNRAGHCNCMGYGYRRKCRHIDLLKKKGFINKDGSSKFVKGEGYAGTNMVPKWIYYKDGRLKRIEFIPA